MRRISPLLQKTRQEHLDPDFAARAYRVVNVLSDGRGAMPGIHHPIIQGTQYHGREIHILARAQNGGSPK